MDDTEFKWVILLALAVIAAGVLWYFRADILAPPEAPAVVEPEPAAPDPVDPGAWDPRAFAAAVARFLAQRGRLVEASSGAALTQAWFVRVDPATMTVREVL